jgi:uncharacterized membrane protein YfcA
MADAIIYGHMLTAAVGLPLTAMVGAAAMTFGAAVIRGLTGFGMAIILVPLLGLIIAPADAVVLAIILQLLIGPVGIRTIVRHAHLASALPLSAAAMVTTPLGIAMLAATAPDVARLLIALVALAAFVLIMLPQLPVGHRPGRLAIALTGTASGLLNGFAAMPGPPVVPFYLRQSLPPLEARASMMLVFFATAIAGTIAAWWAGLVHGPLLILAVLLFGPMLLGNWLGGLAFGRVSTLLWRTGVGVVLGLAGLGAIGRLIGG